MEIKNIEGKYGVWLSQPEMAIIETALRWLENSSYEFEQTTKIGSIKNLRNDLSKLRETGPQVPKKIEVQNDVTEDDIIDKICEECE